MTTTARHTRTTTRLLLAAVLAAAALLAAGPSSAAAATSAALTPTSKCWIDVVNDWLDNGQVDHIYAIPCYTQAIQHLSQFPDVRGYSSAEDDIHNALLAAIRQDRGGGGTSGGTTPGPGNGGPGGSSSFGGPRFLSSAGGQGDAQSIPLPLLVLAGLAILLLLAAAATWAARRFQARRVTPAPAPARRP